MSPNLTDFDPTEEPITHWTREELARWSKIESCQIMTRTQIKTPTPQTFESESIVGLLKAFLECRKALDHLRAHFRCEAEVRALHDPSVIRAIIDKALWTYPSVLRKP